MTSAWCSLSECTLRSASELLPNSSERPGPKSVRPGDVLLGRRRRRLSEVDRGHVCSLARGVLACQSRRSRPFGRARNHPGRPTARRPTVSVAPMSAIRGPAFVGRTTERDVLDGLLARVRGGESEVLVIHGEAGVGKTALLRYAARQASGFRVAELTGVEAEMELPFAGIHQLCATMLDRIRRAPGSATGRPERRSGTDSRGGAGAVPGRTGCAQPAGRGGGGAAAAVSRGGCAVAGRRLKPDPRPRRATGAGGVGGNRYRHPRARRRARLPWSARTAARRAVGAGCPRATARRGDRPARQTRSRPAGCRVPGEPARPCWSYRGA